jgi:hypothetical protein
MRTPWMLVPFLLMGCGAENTMSREAVPKANTGITRACGAAWEGSSTTCPLQQWMRDRVGLTMTDGDMPAVADALERTATWSPDPAWDWQRIALAGAAAARSSEELQVRAACRACHERYRPIYKARYRPRVL